jgi:hypothetical protein
MEFGLIGIVAACFIALTAGKLGHDWRQGADDLKLASVAFVLSMILPSFSAIEGEPGFMIAGMVVGAFGAYRLYCGAVKTVADADDGRRRRSRRPTGGRGGMPDTAEGTRA